MLVARMMHPVLTLGPGERLAIWVAGCKRRCEKCANPELWDFDPSREIPLETLIPVVLELIEKKRVNALTISGGEPFEQAQQLSLLLEALPQSLEDILVFTGYTMQQLQARKDPATDKALSLIGVLVDGEYQDEKNNGHPLRGSDNQRIWFLKPQLEESYRRFIAENKASVQNFATNEDIFSVGIHHRGFREKLEQKKKEKGL